MLEMILVIAAGDAASRSAHGPTYASTADVTVLGTADVNYVSLTAAPSTADYAVLGTSD